MTAPPRPLSPLFGPCGAGPGPCGALPTRPYVCGPRCAYCTPGNGPRAGVPCRLLVTGSRDWDDEQPLHTTFAQVVADHGLGYVTVVHGHCRQGADELADRVAAVMGLKVERHAADWEPCAPTCKPGHRRTRRDGSTYCPGAGLRRDAEMVDLGATLCLALINPCVQKGCRRHEVHGSHGASHTADLAQRAGIPVRRWPRP